MLCRHFCIDHLMPLGPGRTSIYISSPSSSHATLDLRILDISQVSTLADENFTMLAFRVLGAIVGLASFTNAAAYRCTNGGSFYCCANSGPFSSCKMPLWKPYWLRIPFDLFLNCNLGNPATASLGCTGTAPYPVCCLGPGYSCTFAPRADNCACPPVYNCPC